MFRYSLRYFKVNVEREREKRQRWSEGNSWGGHPEKIEVETKNVDEN